ncbi:MAG: hypothetical protein ACLPSY_06475 [Steroidobacteraceae bacterium]
MLSEYRQRPAQFDAEALLPEELGEHRSVFETTARTLDLPVTAMLEIMERGIRRGGKLLFFGNSGSAADAQVRTMWPAPSPPRATVQMS